MSGKIRTRISIDITIRSGKVFAVEFTAAISAAVPPEPVNKVQKMRATKIRTGRVFARGGRPASYRCFMHAYPTMWNTKEEARGMRGP